MNATEAQARVEARIWQAIAQSEADFKSIPHAQLETLIHLATNAALAEIDDELGEDLAKIMAGEKPQMSADDEEEVLWEGRPFLSLTTRYVITNERLRIFEGLLGKDRLDIELVRIQDYDQKQALTERMANVGDIIISSHDPSSPKITLHNVRDPQAVHEILRRAVLAARKKHKLYYREEM
jgi:hypothetical protein